MEYIFVPRRNGLAYRFATFRFDAVAPENKPLGEGVVAVQVPMTYLFGESRIDVLNPAWVAKTHADGLAWHSWFDGPDVDGPEGWKKLVERCVDGVMTSKPKSLERFLKKNRSPSACRLK